MVKGKTSFEAYEYFKQWKTFINSINDKYPPTLKYGFPTTNAWRIMITEIVAVNGITFGLIVATTVALGSVLLFTLNIFISLIAIISILGNILCVLAFFQLVGWTLGAVEALSITILVGLSVDYVLHLAESYNNTEAHADNRHYRVTESLTRMGASVVSGAITTIGSAIMLLFCQLEVFVKFGIIISANIFLSLIFTMFLFTALMATLGPINRQGSIVACMKYTLECFKNNFISRRFQIRPKQPVSKAATLP